MTSRSKIGVSTTARWTTGVPVSCPDDHRPASTATARPIPLADPRRTLRAGSHHWRRHLCAGGSGGGSQRHACAAGLHRRRAGHVVQRRGLCRPRYAHACQRQRSRLCREGVRPALVEPRRRFAGRREDDRYWPLTTLATLAFWLSLTAPSQNTRLGH